MTYAIDMGEQFGQQNEIVSDKKGALKNCNDNMF